MRAIVLEQPKRFRVADGPEPPPPGPSEAVVRVHRVGVCGTDVSGYLGKMPFLSYPRILGHELGVEVAAVGEGVSGVRVGDRCAVEPYLNCGACLACRRGRPNCCETLRVLGVHTDGGLRPLITVPGHKLHRSDRLTLEQLALVETLGIGCHAVCRGDPEPGENVLVVGAGPIGLSVIVFAKLAGATVTVLDVNEARLDFCRRAMGVDRAVRELPAGETFAAVFDATGNAAAMERSFESVGFTGRLVFVGIVPGEVRFPDPLLHRREMTVLASRNSLPADFTRIIGLIEAGKIDTRPWVSHRCGFDELIDRFPSYADPATGVIKAVVEVS